MPNLTLNQSDGWTELVAPVAEDTWIAMQMQTPNCFVVYDFVEAEPVAGVINGFYLFAGNASKRVELHHGSRRLGLDTLEV